MIMMMMLNDDDDKECLYINDGLRTYLAITLKNRSLF
jgi:hypothetical protein